MTDIDTADVLTRVKQLLADHPPATTAPLAFLGERFDRGLAWVHFPEGQGGLGTSPALGPVVEDALAAAGAPEPPPVGLIARGMVAPTLVAHGSGDQQRHLRPMFTGEEIWCQLFSEPGAGSDVASLGTRAERDGDEWVVDGQKVWTSVAHLAHHGLLLARTDPDVPKHRGITAFLLDMRSPGVDIRPLHQITSEAEFNEVYMTGVRIPDARRVGEAGEGWRVALTTLMNERVAIGGNVPPRGSGFIGHVVNLWKERGHDDPARRDDLLRLWVRAEVLRLTNMRAGHLRSLGTPGPEGTIGKAMGAVFNQQVSAFALALLGAEGMLKPGGYPMDRPTSVSMWANPQQAFLRSVANTIEGGTTEIAKNILAERVLGLPADRRDRDTPWRALRRS